MNVENEWSDSIDASKADGAMKRIQVEEVRCAMNRMKTGKQVGLLGLLQNCLKLVGISL